MCSALKPVLPHCPTGKEAAISGWQYHGLYTYQELCTISLLSWYIFIRHIMALCWWSLQLTMRYPSRAIVELLRVTPTPWRYASLKLLELTVPVAGFIVFRLQLFRWNVFTEWHVCFIVSVAYELAALRNAGCWPWVGGNADCWCRSWVDHRFLIAMPQWLPAWSHLTTSSVACSWRADTVEFLSAMDVPPNIEILLALFLTFSV